MHSIKAFGVALAVSAMTLSSAAMADDVTPKAAKAGATTLETIVISVKRQRPLASIDVNRIPLESTMKQLKQPLVDRISKAADKEPF